MKLIEDSLAGLALGAPQAHANLAFFPLTGPASAAGYPNYLLLDDALERELARVTEVSEGGSVPELAFENVSAGRVLLVDGDELIGAKQNRVLNLSILVGGGRRVVIPVSCVEQGRWAWRERGFSTAKRALFAKARARKYARVSESLRSRGTREADQGEVWADVAEKVAFAQAESSTMAMSDAYDSLDDRVGAFVGAFRAEDGQRGAVIALDGKVAGLELFDSAATFSRYLEKLVRSWAVDALETEGGGAPAPVADDARRFVEAIKRAAAERFEAVGEGEDLRLSGDGIAAGALAAEGRVVHLAGFVVGG